MERRRCCGGDWRRLMRARVRAARSVPSRGTKVNTTNLLTSISRDWGLNFCSQVCGMRACA
eukprot:5350800-Pleurochrysis_carterae.AAC.2